MQNGEVRCPVLCASLTIIEKYLHLYKCSAVAEMGDRLAFDYLKEFYFNMEPRLNGIWPQTGLRPASKLDSVMEFGR